MSVDLALAPKRKRLSGEACCEPVAYPEVTSNEAAEVASVARALADPIRVQLVDVLRRHAGEVCVCELQPLFDISQPTLSSHLRRLREARPGRAPAAAAAGAARAAARRRRPTLPTPTASSASISTTRPRARARPPRRWPPRSAAGCRPRWPTCTRARPCSTSARAPVPTS